MKQSSDLTRTAAVIALGLATLALTACVIEPVRPAVQVRPIYDTPRASMIYIAPNYARPAPDYEWRRHEHYGWGWQHPNRGWYRGWR
jgi:hypothetical protein